MLLESGKLSASRNQLLIHLSSQPQSDLLELIQVMIVVFGEEPPVFSRPTVSAGYPPYQATGPPTSKWSWLPISTNALINIPKCILHGLLRNYTTLKWISVLMGNGFAWAVLDLFDLLEEFVGFFFFLVFGSRGKNKVVLAEGKQKKITKQTNNTHTFTPPKSKQLLMFWRSGISLKRRYSDNCIFNVFCILIIQVHLLRASWNIPYAKILLLVLPMCTIVFV